MSAEIRGGKVLHVCCRRFDMRLTRLLVWVVVVVAGPYLDLCLQSRSMYPDWAALLEDIAGPGFSTGFSASGGFLAPAFEGDPVFHWQPPLDAGPSYWLDRTQIRWGGGGGPTRHLDGGGQQGGWGL